MAQTEGSVGTNLTNHPAHPGTVRRPRNVESTVFRTIPAPAFLIALRTGIERTFGLVKENRYRMEETNFYRGIDNVTIHAVEHDIVLTQDTIFD
jgi:hypothetical protein